MRRLRSYNLKNEVSFFGIHKVAFDSEGFALGVEFRRVESTNCHPEYLPIPDEVFDRAEQTAGFEIVHDFTPGGKADVPVGQTHAHIWPPSLEERIDAAIDAEPITEEEALPIAANGRIERREHMSHRRAGRNSKAKEV